jgi:hypothetical protein
MPIFKTARRNRMKFTIIAFSAALALILTLVLVAFGQYNAYNQLAVPDQIKKLFVFQGNWEGEATMVYKGKTLPKFKLTQMTIILPNNFGIQTDETATIPTIGFYYSFNTMGYDSGDDKVHFSAINNLGDAHDHQGNWINEKTLVLEYFGSYSTKPIIERIPITIINDHTYSIADTVFAGGEIQKAMTVIMKKI